MSQNLKIVRFRAQRAVRTRLHEAEPGVSSEDVRSFSFIFARLFQQSSNIAGHELPKSPVKWQNVDTLLVMSYPNSPELIQNVRFVAYQAYGYETPYLKLIEELHSPERAGINMRPRRRIAGSPAC